MTDGTEILLFLLFEHKHLITELYLRK